MCILVAFNYLSHNPQALLLLLLYLLYIFVIYGIEIEKKLLTGNRKSI